MGSITGVSSALFGHSPQLIHQDQFSEVAATEQRRTFPESGQQHFETFFVVCSKHLLMSA